MNKPLKEPLKKWQVYRSADNELMLNTDDAKEVKRTLDKLELAAKDEPPFPGQVGGKYRLDGDPVELGLATDGHE